ncbi:MAG: response regulator [Desulfobacteraceae bacterium]|nr:response regulator [Desulfobacteraceae bacterium]MBC2718044.1 response regulator [Desulfobacteraceae bacterium]
MNPIDTILKNTRMRTKILVATIMVVGFFMGLSLYQSLVIHKETAMNQVAGSSDHLLESIYSGIKFPMSVGDSKTIRKQMKDIKYHMEGVQVYISDFQNMIMYASEDERIYKSMVTYLYENKSRDALAESLLTGQAPDISFSETENHTPYLITIKPILNEDSCHHCHGSIRKVLGAMIIKQPVKEVFTAIVNTRNSLIVYFIAAIIGVVVVINFFFSRLVTKRIQHLRAKTGQVAGGDVTVVVHDDHKDSIGGLSRNFNLMVKSIRDRIEYANSLKLGIVDPFLMVDPDMKVTFINENAARLSGLTPEEAIGKPCHEVFHSSACKKDCPVKKAIQTGKVTKAIKFTLTDSKGKEIPVVSISSILRDSSGKILGAFEIIRDITVEVEAENRLQEAYLEEEKAREAAEAAALAKSEFLANMSHEIRTPMHGVIAATELALNEEMPPKAEHYLKIIQSSAYSLLGIINDILDFSKIEADKLDLEIRPFSIDDIMDRSVDVLINKVAEKSIEIIVDIDIDTPKALIGDPLRLQQIITNLISNAIKFTDNEGTVLLGVKDTEKSMDHVVLTFFVKDTGVGIAPEHLNKLFVPFSQVDASSTRKYEGTGLGLTICKQLVEKMGGRIWAESEPGKGSTFTFTAHFGFQSVQQERKLVPPPDIQDLRVLVVDDCAETRTIMQKILESFGLHVELVGSGMESLSLLKDKRDSGEPFELVIIDWLMPGLDGIETTKKIRRELKLSIPIILMTAFGKEAEALDIEKDGITGFLAKPIYQSMLFNAIMDAFGKEQLKNSGRDKPIITSTSIYKKRLKGIRVLVAEDNPTNQEIALAILEGAGMVVKIVRNGKEAVAAVLEGGFDAVLMDIQMPEMDGYEATRMIRGREEESGISVRGDKIPIIAMTAHAMKGDEEKCLEAGMDAYVSKPINQNRLFRALWHSLKFQQISVQYIETDASADGLPAELPGIKIRKALKALNIDGDIFKSILTKFLGSNKDTISNIRSAFEGEDWESLMHLSHSLKGSAGSIGADELHKAAQELETAGKEGALTSALLDRVETALNQVLESLQSLADTSKTEPLPGKERGVGPAVDPAQVMPVLKQLADALDLAEPEEIEKHIKVIKKYLDISILKDIEDQVNDYEYDRALETLKGIIEGLRD